MTSKRPDSDRRLVPRWRSFTESVNAKELTTEKATSSATQIAVPKSAHFDALLDEWRTNKSLEIAADLLGSAVALGRSKEADPQAAAELVVTTKTLPLLSSLANRTLAGTIGQSQNPEQISFDPDEARATLRSQLAAHKYRVRMYPKNPISWVDMARLYTALGQEDKAYSALLVALSLAPNNRFVLRCAAKFFVHAHTVGSAGHTGGIDEGLHYLRHSRALKLDPWIMAAEISLATILGSDPASLKLGRVTATADDLHPRDLSELNGALATFGLYESGGGRPGKLFKKSLRSPTENAVAQAQWASNKYKLFQLPADTFEHLTTPAFEAQALKAREEHRWSDAIEACRSWSAADPTSTRPLIMGSFIADVAMEDGFAAADFCERASLIAPNEHWIQNNLAVAYAYAGDLDLAREHSLRSQQVHDLTPAAKAVRVATKGLIAYRAGNPAEGFLAYAEALQMDAARSDFGLSALLAWHMAREEAIVDPAGVRDFADVLWKATSRLPIPELEGLRSTVENRISTAASQTSVANNSSLLPKVNDVVPDLFRRSK